MHEVRRLSSALFGARYRLEICAALGERSTITATDLLSELRQTADPPSQASLSVELKRLCAAGLLSPMPVASGDRLRHLEVVQSPIWRAAAEIVASTRQRSTS